MEGSKMQHIFDSRLAILNNPLSLMDSTSLDSEPAGPRMSFQFERPGRWSNGMTAESHSANRGSIPRRSTFHRF